MGVGESGGERVTQVEIDEATGSAMRARSAPPAERWRSSSATGAQGGGGCTGRGYRSRAVTSPYETPWAKRIFAKKYTSAPSSGGSAYPCARRQVRVAAAHPPVGRPAGARGPPCRAGSGRTRSRPDRRASRPRRGGHRAGGCTRAAEAGTRERHRQAGFPFCENRNDWNDWNDHDWWDDRQGPPLLGWGPPPAYQWTGGPPRPFNYWGYDVNPVWDNGFHQCGIWLFGLWIPIFGIGVT